MSRYCMICGTPNGLHKHHIISRGAGGKDNPENLIDLCWKCHHKTHEGWISKETLWQLVGKRDGITADQAESISREVQHSSRWDVYA